MSVRLKAAFKFPIIPSISYQLARSTQDVNSVLTSCLAVGALNFLLRLQPSSLILLPLRGVDEQSLADCPVEYPTWWGNFSLPFVLDQVGVGYRRHQARCSILAAQPHALRFGSGFLPSQAHTMFGLLTQNQASGAPRDLKCASLCGWLPPNTGLSGACVGRAAQLPEPGVVRGTLGVPAWRFWRGECPLA